MRNSVDDVAQDLSVLVEQTAPRLQAISRDYVKHLRHHLEQILDPEASAGKAHPPFY